MTIEQKIVDYRGKKYLRFGSCSRCGTCCTGWAGGPCPHLIIQPDGKSSCDAYAERDSEWMLEEHRSGKLVANPLGCIMFPEGPLEDPVMNNMCNYRFKPIEKVIVACPTYDGKEYSMQRWIDSVNALDWPDYEVLMVDTSEKRDFYERWKDKVPMARVEAAVGRRPSIKIAIGMEHIRLAFLKGNYDFWFNLEADVILPPETLKFLIQFTPAADWVSHCYPARGNPKMADMGGFGCSIFNRRIAEVSFMEVPDSDSYSLDGWWWHEKIEYNPNHFSCVEMWNVLRLEHLNE